MIIFVVDGFGSYGKTATLQLDEGTTVGELKTLLAARLGFSMSTDLMGGHRDSCSFLCRTSLYGFATDALSPVTNDRIYKVFGRMGSCVRGCRKLIRPSELQASAFTIQERIGFGSSADVFAVFHTATHQAGLVLKVIRCRDSVEQGQLLERYRTLSKLDSPRIVPFISAFVKDQDVGVLMPRYKGTLQDEMRGGRVFSQELVHAVAINVLQGLAALAQHTPPIVHRDVKASNIFLAPSHKPGVDYFVLGDMEAARFLLPGVCSTTGGTGTFANLAPEQILCRQSTIKTDTWGLGCVLFWLCVGGSAPPRAMHASAQLEGPRFADSLRTDLHRADAGMRELVVAMLSPQPDQRPSADACLAAAEESASRLGYKVHTCTCGLPTASWFVTEECPLLV